MLYGESVQVIHHGQPGPGCSSCAPSQHLHGPACGCKEECRFEWFQEWTCEDLQMKPFEPLKSDCCGRPNFFWCPEAEEEKKECGCNGNGHANGNGNGHANGNGNGNGHENGNGHANGNGNGEAEAEEPEEEEGPTTPLMKWLHCRKGDHEKGYWHDCCEKEKHAGPNIFGWVQMGFTGNWDSPRDRRNFGTGYNWRSNDYQLNQLFLVIEKELEHGDEFNVGYRIDTMIGTDAPFNVQQGLFDRVVGTGQVNRIGFDLPQFYVEAHIPGLLGKGTDIKFGKWYTLVNYEVIPATGNFFYSHTYNFFAGPFNCTGVLATTHLTDTIDVMYGIFQGWEKFEDNNNAPSYTAAVSWTSCDERYSWVTAMQTGPEQDDNEGNYRTAISSFFTTNFGYYNEWSWVVGGNWSYESQAVEDGFGNVGDAQWYSANTWLFYTVTPKLKLGARAEWFHDDDGYRTGAPGSFYDLTFGLNWFPYKNLRIRPEIRFDWAADSIPYNDQTDSQQITTAIDLIWEF